MDELIKSVYDEWRIANADAVRKCRDARLHILADKLAECELLTGTETLPELIDIIFSPQGREFMTRFGFPSVETFRRFLPYHPEQYGVFIDAAGIALTDVSRVFLIGNTSARLNYRETQGNTVILMHGASAEINAGGYSVLRVERDAESPRPVVHSKDHAVVVL